MTIGIYSILNKVNHKIYIGQSLDIEKRLKHHMDNSSNLELRKDIEKFGLNKFEFSILKKCNASKLDTLEKKYIKHFQNKGIDVYNLSLVDKRLKKANRLDETIKEYGLSYIKSNNDYLINRYGEVYSKKQYRFISSYYVNNKEIITLSDKGNKKTYTIKSLLIEAFGDEGTKYYLDNEKNKLKDKLNLLDEEIREVKQDLDIIKAKYQDLKQSKKALLTELNNINLETKEPKKNKRR